MDKYHLLFLANKLILCIAIIIIPLATAIIPQRNTVLRLTIPIIVRLALAPWRVHPGSPISPSELSLSLPVIPSYPASPSTPQIVGESALIKRMYGGQVSSIVQTGLMGLSPGTLNIFSKDFQ